MKVCFGRGNIKTRENIARNNACGFFLIFSVEFAMKREKAAVNGDKHACVLGKHNRTMQKSRARKGERSQKN